MKRSSNKQNLPLSPLFRRALVAAAIMTMSMAMIGCGKQAYQNIASTTSAQAPGSYIIPPKVDILLVEDDTGSMNEIFEPVSKQMPAFLNQLEEQGWDYHFAVIPLTQYRPITEVVASKYDPNWGSLWKSPYPGADQSNLPGTITASAFRTPGDSGNFNGFLTGGFNSLQMGREDGLENIRDILSFEKAVVPDQGNSSNFLRQDALLAIVVVGNGNDTSGIEYITQNGISVPKYSGQEAASFNYYLEELKNIKPNSSQMKFFAAVSARQTTSNCLGAKASIGLRYQEMAKAFGGARYDICTQPIASVLDSIAGNLQAQKLSMRTRYLFVDQEPNPATIKITRYIGGDANNAVNIEPIENDGENGWKYVGKVNDVYVIDSPIPMNQASGYAIELFGTAKLLGDDTAKVESMPAWVQ